MARSAHVLSSLHVLRQVAAGAGGCGYPLDVLVGISLGLEAIGPRVRDIAVVYYRDLHERRGASDFDVRHRFVASYIYELPFGKGRAYLNSGPVAEILGGWRISGLGNIRTGRPFTARAGNNDSVLAGPRSVGISAFADCLRDGSLSGSARTIDRWFDAGAFATPSALNPTTGTTQARLGNCGRNTLRGPGITNFDFSLARSFAYFGEGRDLELRWEVFNMFNTPQFGLPERNINSTSVGRITTLAGDPRVMQLALKFNF